jgi:hypothetical protein
MRRLVIVCLGVAAILAVSTGVARAATCAEEQYAEMFAQFLADWPTFTEGVVDGPDHNWDNIPDPYQLALVAAAICKDPAAQALYAANLEVAQEWVAANPWGWDPAPPANLANQIAAEAMWDCGKMAIDWYFWVSQNPWHDDLACLPGLAADADYDGDGYTNKEEYDFIAAQGGSPTDYAFAATGGIAGAGVPVAGLVGLGLLAGASAIGGALLLRRKK